MMIGPMNTIKAHLLTGGITLLVGAILVAVWMHLYPLDIPRLARVDIGRLVAYQQQSLVQRIKPGLLRSRPNSLRKPRRSARGWIPPSIRSVGNADVR